MHQKQLAGKIERLKKHANRAELEITHNDFRRIGQIVDHIHEGEWWLIQSAGHVEWLCGRVVALRDQLEKRVVA